MDLLLIGILIVAILAMGGWGYSYYTARPAVEVVPAPAAGPSPLIHLLGLVGLILLVAFVVMLITGWRFGLDVVPPR